MDTRTLVELGERVGLSGAELKEWMAEEEKRQRDERASEREAAKERDLLAVEREKIAAERASAERARAEAEERSLQLRIRLAELDAAREDRTQQGEPNEGMQAVRSQTINPRKFLPQFEDARDDLDAYLKRFECVATSQSWEKSQWAIALSMCLTGEALKVYGRLPPEDCLDYSKVKIALLRRFRFTAEGYRERFRASKPENGESATQFTSRIKGYFDRWIELSETPNTFEGLVELIVKEQLLSNCSRKLVTFLRERENVTH